MLLLLIGLEITAEELSGPGNDARAADPDAAIARRAATSWITARPGGPGLSAGSPGP
jgi:hypothetical protein